MHLLWWIGLIPFLTANGPFVQSLTCDQATMYDWLLENSTVCCDKCPPGQHLSKRCTKTSKSQCVVCHDGYYLDSYNTDFICKSCRGCSMSGQQHVSECSTIRDDVCSCKEGFRCKGPGPCEECEVMPSQTESTHIQTTSITAATSSTQPTQGDMTWILVLLIVIIICSLLYCLFTKTNLRFLLQWIISKNNLCSPQKYVLSSQSTEEEVSMPVQEECGKPELDV